MIERGFTGARSRIHRGSRRVDSPLYRIITAIKHGDGYSPCYTRPHPNESDGPHVKDGNARMPADHDQAERLPRRLSVQSMARSPLVDASGLTSDLDLTRKIRTELAERGRWFEAHKLVNDTIDLALRRPDPAYGLELAGLVYVPGGPRPDKSALDPGAERLTPERGLAMSAVLLANRGSDRAAVVEHAKRLLDSQDRCDTDSFSYAVHALIYADELDIAQEYCHRAQHSSESIKILRHHHSLAMLRARLAFLTGNPLLSRNLLDQVLTSGVHYQFASLAVAWMVVALVELEEFERAEELLREHGFDGSLDGVADRVELLAARGMLQFALGRFRQGCDDAVACGRELANRGVLNPAVVPWRSQAALCAQRAQRVTLARALVEDELAAARRWGTGRAIAVTLHALALVRDDASSIGSLDTAVRLLEPSAARGELFRVQYSLGLLLTARNQRERARIVLDDARRTALKADNDVGLTKADRALRHIAESRAHDKLTSQEYEVAKLAHAGYSNRAIAERMCLATVTVEFHLSKVYRKLGISGRGELGTSIFSW